MHTMKNNILLLVVAGFVGGVIVYSMWIRAPRPNNIVGAQEAPVCCYFSATGKYFDNTHPLNCTGGGGQIVQPGDALYNQISCNATIEESCRDTVITYVPSTISSQVANLKRMSNEFLQCVALGCDLTPDNHSGVINRCWAQDEVLISPTPTNQGGEHQTPGPETNEILRQMDALQLIADEITVAFSRILDAFNEVMIDCPECFFDPNRPGSGRGSEADRELNPPTLGIVARCEGRPYGSCIDIFGNGIDGCRWDNIMGCYGSPTNSGL